MNKTKILEEFRKEFATGSGYIRAVTKGSLMNTVPKIESFLSTTIDTLIGEIEGEIKQQREKFTGNDKSVGIARASYRQALDTFLTLLATYKK